jgi:hypothetical protein
MGFRIHFLIMKAGIAHALLVKTPTLVWQSLLDLQVLYLLTGFTKVWLWCRQQTHIYEGLLRVFSGHSLSTIQLWVTCKRLVIVPARPGYRKSANLKANGRM